MGISEKSEFMHYMKAVLRFYQEEASAAVLDVWWNICEPYSMKQVRAAITAYTASASGGLFAPNPIDIATSLQEVKSDAATQAWRKVVGAVQHVGAYKDIRFDDGLIHLVIQGLGGWPALCKTVRAERASFERRFCESYRAYCVCQQESVDGKNCKEWLLRYPSFLIGDRKPDAFYKKHNLRVPAPVDIGELRGCAYVERTGIKPHVDDFDEGGDVVESFFNDRGMSEAEMGEARGVRG